MNRHTGSPLIHGVLWGTWLAHVVAAPVAAVAAVAARDATVAWFAVFTMVAAFGWRHLAIWYRDVYRLPPLTMWKRGHRR